MTHQVDSVKAFFAKLETMPELPEIVWPNVTASPKSDHVRVFVLPTETESETLGCDKWGGLYQASVFVKDGAGIIEANRIADLLINAFPKNMVLTEGSTRIRITRKPFAAPVIIEAGWLSLPVSIPFEGI